MSKAFDLLGDIGGNAHHTHTSTHKHTQAHTQGIPVPCCVQLSTLTNSSEVSVLPSGSAAPPMGCGVAIVDDATVAHLMLKGILDPALEVAKLQKKVGAPVARCFVQGYMAVHGV
eukprot:1151847-Pelagomonas_calceolata.AAC.3